MVGRGSHILPWHFSFTGSIINPTILHQYPSIATHGSFHILRPFHFNVDAILSPWSVTIWFISWWVLCWCCWCWIGATCDSDSADMMFWNTNQAEVDSIQLQVKCLVHNALSSRTPLDASNPCMDTLSNSWTERLLGNEYFAQGKTFLHFGLKTHVLHSFVSAEIHWSVHVYNYLPP